MEGSATADPKASVDPMLLGVAVPVTVTMDAAKQVVTAWETCFKELLSALKTKAAGVRAPAAAPAPAEVQA